MPHCEPDELALLALGEPADVDVQHLATCKDCAQELSALRSVVLTGRSGSRADVPVAPPPEVWHRIAEELDLSPAAAATAVGDTGARDTGPEAAADQTVVPLAPRRRRFRPMLLAAAAGVVGIALGAGATFLALHDEAEPDVLVASAALDPLPTWPAASGAATVVERDGQRHLLVDVSAPPGDAGAAYREVWLLDADAKRLVSIGLLRGEHGDFVLPDGVDLADFPVVDVSQEPIDGDPAHSGDSIVRGTLDA